MHFGPGSTVIETELFATVPEQYRGGTGRARKGKAKSYQYIGSDRQVGIVRSIVSAGRDGMVVGEARNVVLACPSLELVWRACA